jgi:hypothetical protein
MTLRTSFVTLLIVCAAAAAAAQEAARPQAAADGWVVLPVNEYRALRAKAFPPDRPPDPPPVDAAISGVDYELTVSGESASGQARLTVDVLKEGWVRIPMPPGLLIREARLDSRPVALVDQGPDGRSRAPVLLLSRRGRALLTLDIVVPITARGGVEQLGLPASAAALVRAALTVPRADVDVSVSGGFIGDQTKEAKVTKVVAFGQGGQPLSLFWSRARENHRAAQALRMRSTVTEVVGLGEDAAQLTTRVQIEVVQGVASTVSLTLPAGFTVNEVSGALVSDWEMRGAALAVSFLEPVSERVTFVLTGEFRPPREGRIAVPLVQVAQVERETGGVAVEVLGAGEITRHEARGLDPADPSDLGEALAGRDSPALVAFRFRAHDGQAARSLAVTVSRYTPQAVLLANVEDARYRVLLAEDGKALVEGRFAVRNNQRSFLGVTLPAGASLWSASIDGRATRPGTSADGTLLVPLPKARAGAEAPVSAVQLIYLHRQTAWATNGQVKFALPALDVPVSRTGVLVDFSPRFRVTLEPGAFRVDVETPLQDALTVFDAKDAEGSMFHARGNERFGVSVDRITAGKIARQEAASELSVRMKADGGGDRERDEERKAQDDLRGLADRFQKESRGTRAPGVVPVRMAVPRVGATMFLVSELTPERVPAELTLTYKREGK